jgi:NAD(P)-dependent dehydrogenase (short-subunit alcohol dehydrogenase family)
VGSILKGKGLDILINNIGIAQEPFEPYEAPLDLFREEFEVNTLGPQIVTVAFLPLLRKGNKKIIMNMFFNLPFIC